MSFDELWNRTRLYNQASRNQACATCDSLALSHVIVVVFGIWQHLWCYFLVLPCRGKRASHKLHPLRPAKPPQSYPTFFTPSSFLNGCDGGNDQVGRRVLLRRGRSCGAMHSVRGE